jgi:hypothetical protein
MISTNLIARVAQGFLAIAATGVSLLVLQMDHESHQRVSVRDSDLSMQDVYAEVYL